MIKYVCNFMNPSISISHKLSLLLICVLYFSTKTDCFKGRFHYSSHGVYNLNNIFKFNHNFYGGGTYDNLLTLHSRTSIETVIHTGDYKNYDPNCIKYRKAKYWREKSDLELQEELRKVRKVLVKIEECIKTKDPTLLPESKRQAKRTQAQLLFLLHERHLNSLREQERKKLNLNQTK